MSGLLTKQAIVEARDVPFEDVEVPEWGGTVRIRTMDGTARDRYDMELLSRIKKGKDGKVEKSSMVGLPRLLLVHCLVDEQGELLFSVSEIEELTKKSGAVIEKLFKVAGKLNGLDLEAEEQALGN